MAAGGSGVVPLSLGMLSLLGAGAVCQDTPVDGPGQPSGIEGCYKMAAGGTALIEIKFAGDTDFQLFSNVFPWTEVVELIGVTVEVVDGNRFVSRLSFNRTNGGPFTADSLKYDTSSEAVRVQWRLRPVSGACEIETGDPLPYPPNFRDPISYTDPTTQCNYNITPQGFVAESEGGGAGFVMKIEAAAPQTLASGGVVGGCNFSPTLVYQPPGGGPPTTVPWDPTWPDWDGGGTPPWLATLIGAAGGVAATVINNALAALFEQQYPSGTREIYAACNYKQDGSPETFSVTFPEENYQNRVLTSLNAIVDFQQQILLWRTPTCSGGSQPVKGDAVSINWVSDEYSPSGNNRIRKLLTYFDQNNTSLEDTVTHWKDFSWNAGPVIVSCVGTPLGKPQVWADSLDEAKRVIGHAAAIAGVDLTNAEWQVAPPKSSRYGMTGVMRVATGRSGQLSITKRDGPSGLPEVLTPISTPGSS